MKTKINKINSLILSNKIELNKAQKIKQEIKENINFNLYDDGLVLL